MRNPKWHRDEVVLALNLYFKLEKGAIHSQNPEIITLSEILNKLSIFKNKDKLESFCNPNSVSLKLSNFLAIDTDYAEGMKSHSRLDKVIFLEFINNRRLLETVANNIKLAIDDVNPVQKLTSLVEDEEEEHIAAKEGMVFYRLHKYRERDSLIVAKKKASFMRKNGHLSCELCHFDFEKAYGDAGKGFIECHHKIPLHKLQVQQVTKLDDLLLVCSNCHRMLHRGWIIDSEVLS